MRAHKRGGGSAKSVRLRTRVRGEPCQCVRTQYDCCNAPNKANNSIKFFAKGLQSSTCVKENDGRPEGSAEGRENSDVGFVRDRTLEVA